MISNTSFSVIYDKQRSKLPTLKNQWPTHFNMKGKQKKEKFDLKQKLESSYDDTKILIYEMKIALEQDYKSIREH
jgi:hypothetical protein